MQLRGRDNFADADVLFMLIGLWCWQQMRWEGGWCWQSISGAVAWQESFCSFSNCSPQRHHSVASSHKCALALCCAPAEWKELRPKLPNLSHFYRPNVLNWDCKWRRWPTLNQIVAKGQVHWSIGPLSTRHQNLNRWRKRDKLNRQNILITDWDRLNSEIIVKIEKLQKFYKLFFLGIP